MISLTCLEKISNSGMLSGTPALLCPAKPANLSMSVMMMDLTLTVFCRREHASKKISSVFRCSSSWKTCAAARGEPKRARGQGRHVSHRGVHASDPADGVLAPHTASLPRRPCPAQPGRARYLDDHLHEVLLGHGVLAVDDLLENARQHELRHGVVQSGGALATGLPR